MPNLEAQAAWVPVREIGIELARGGPNGNMNEQATALLARTEYLKQQKANKYEIVQGIYEFGTYSEFDALKASLPLNCTVVINEVNTTGVGSWGIGNNRWDGTGLTKSSYDPLTQAKNYTDTSLPITKYGNTYNSANNVAGVYIHNGGTVTTDANSILAVVPVEAGKTYAIKSSSFAASYFFVGLKANNNTAVGQTSTIAALSTTADPAVKTFTVPAGSTAKFALINVKVASSFDVRTGFVVNEGTAITSTDPGEETVQKIRGANVADVKAREEIKQIKAQPYIAESDLVVVKSGNLYSQHTNGFYIVIGTVNFAVNADSAVGFFPIEAGKTYAIKPGNFNASYFSLMLKADNVVGSGTGTNATGMLVATSDPAVKTLTVPADSTAKFALLNVKVASSFDIRNTLVVNEGTSITSTDPGEETVQKIRGANVADVKAREEIKQIKAQPYIAESDLVVVKSGNLYSQHTNGFYIVIGTVNFAVNADSAVGFFPIEAGKTYAIKPGNFNASYFSLMLKADNVVGSGTGTNATGMLVATSDPAVKTLTVPADSTAKFALLNVKVASSFDIRNTLVVNEGTSITDSTAYKEIVNKIKGKKVQDEDARALIKAVDDKVTGSIVSPLKDKKWVVIGDSITEVNFRTNKNYHAYVSDNVGGMTIHNYGQSGSGYYGRFNVASTVTQDPDYVTVFFGTNDWQNSDAGNTKLLGMFGDTDNTTIAGCVYLCLSQLVSKFYNKRIAVFTPLPRSDNYGSNAAPNSRGFTLEQLAKVIKQTADHLSIPCLDLYHESNLPVWVYAGNQFYFTPPTGGSADGLHPNDEGHKIIARKVQKFLESI